ncbi:MAG: Asp-tRNA(Asn)/Glu-tRNA(Gln) amidotransferase subunit GatC [Thermodesulfovibrionales bacterium]|nr:Asp-tRNA(Asn)/Glu-tRNA(Gln) amidotransferase subunit GatC [Thermodesulfovibrionales bacterium]
MNITDNETRHIAHLSRLEFSEEEIKLMGLQLNKILEFINKLNEIDTKDVEPTSHILELHNVFREDEIVESIGTDVALSNAPDRNDSFFRVPKIIE